jgi:alpha-D-xyloside xylohydrolase
LTVGGDAILSEQPQSGRTVPAAEAGASGDGVGQGFLLSPGEALYGLGQHQEGFFNLRDIPVQLLQANSNIAIPFLISSNGYGLLWNNPALTDFNPATETVQLDQNGAGTFQSGPEGEYGFLLSGNYRNKLRLSVDGQQILDLNNMWLPLSVGAKMHLAANSTYKVVAETGGDTRLAVRAPADTMAFRSQVGDAVDYYFLYGPEPKKVVAEYRDFTGAAAAVAAVGIRLLAVPGTLLESATDSRYGCRVQEAKDPSRCSGSGLAVLGQVWLERHAL